MSRLPRILFYDDNPEFGGHQVMAALGMEGLVHAGLCEAHFWFSPANERWQKRLRGLQSSGLQCAAAPTRTARLQVLRNLWQRSPELRRRLAMLQPDRIVFIQGDIEHASLAVMEAVRLRHSVMSYIPMAHRYEVMQARLPHLRDLLASRVFKAIPDWITISESCRAQLVERNPKARVRVVENGIPVECFRREETVLRSRLGIPDGQRVCAMIGRVEFNQKRQDLALEAFTRYPEHFSGWHLLLVGSGPDGARLDALVQGSSARARVHRLEWLEQPEAVYSAIDCLLLPSGYEGVPLVMLEALAAGVPVIASDRDGMKDLLPPGWRFPAGDAAALAQTFRAACDSGFSGVEELQSRVRRENTVEAFQQQFTAAVLDRL